MVAGRIECLLHGDRYPEIKRIPYKRAVELFRRDTDDRVLNAVEILRSADDVRIEAISILPRSVADHHYRMRVTSNPLLRSEAAPQNRFHTEGVEIVCRHNSRRRALRSIPHAERCARDLTDDERFKQG